MGRSDGPAYPADVLEPAAWDPRIHPAFAWLTRWMFRKKFAGVRVVRGSPDVLAALDVVRGPVIVCMNHASWWDPLLGILIWSRSFPSRGGVSPIDLDQFRKFKIFAKLGLFGIAPDHPGASRAFEAYVSQHFADDAKPTLYLTPQGRFTDVREAIRIRPGAAAIASKHPGAKVVSVAAEYAFWGEQKPEVFVRAVEIDAPETPSRGNWQRAITATMQSNADELARLVIQKDAGPFDNLIETKTAGVHPLYNAWLRLRGHDPRVEVRRETDRARRDARPGREGRPA
ncbi:MAG: lysophospholipid acyltransferase family protein [Planctomycetota bacterium]